MVSEVAEAPLADVVYRLVEELRPVRIYYPGEIDEPTSDQVEDALQFMRQVFSVVSDRLPSEASS